MEGLLFVVIAFSLLTIFELYKEYKRGNLPKKTYVIIGTMEGIAASISFALFYVM